MRNSAALQAVEQRLDGVKTGFVQHKTNLKQHLRIAIKILDSVCAEERTDYAGECIFVPMSSRSYRYDTHTYATYLY
jgi:hypothetical protein